MSRYPEDWRTIALTVKEQAGWRCAKCDLQCLRPGDDITGLTKSERTKITLTVHHHNRMPEDNRPENLIALKPQLSPGLPHPPTVEYSARSAIV
ncbi:HNH endonuclease [Laspinema olomoucense]|uniref:HNH endonuclease n=1 Tax=Laspinema olomoucense D3b TaxID=2953688 RepID=A0ABT2NF86_9CYAN|nr:HNH endonuclease [Laspinema sp. D3b]MCT7981373.1 HNH endonuclease [Laspinema sp. D3b]